jgi:serine/threonine-protein kinase RIO1
MNQSKKKENKQKKTSQLRKKTSQLAERSVLTFVKMTMRQNYINKTQVIMKLKQDNVALTINFVGDRFAMKIVKAPRISFMIIHYFKHSLETD